MHQFINHLIPETKVPYVYKYANYKQSNKFLKQQNCLK